MGGAMQTCNRTSRAGTRSRARRGASMIVVLMAVSVGAVMLLALVTGVNSTRKEQRGSMENLSALYVSEAGLSHAVFDLGSGGTGVLGSEQNPIPYGDSGYWVEAVDLGGGKVSLVSTGTDGRAGSQIEVVVREQANGFYQWAAYGDESLDLDSNAFIDSYDSTVGDYDSQAVNSSGGDTWANEDGDVGSNGNIVMKQNSTVFGDAQCGPSASTSVVGNAELSGSSTPAADLVELPPLVIPGTPSAGDLTVPGGTTHSMPAGDYAYGSFLASAGSTVKVYGPSTIVLTNMELASNSQFVVDATNGPVEVYVLEDFIIGSNTLLTSTTYSPADLEFFLESDNVIDPDLTVDLDEVDFNSNAKMYGTIYAPNAAVAINSNFELFGALVAHSVLLDSNAKVHYDESLGWTSSGASVAFDTLCWRELPYTP